MKCRFFFFILIFMVSIQVLYGQRREVFKSYFKIVDTPYGREIGKNAPAYNTLDVYMPKKGANSPVVIWIHDGPWTSDDKTDVDNKPEYFTEKGYIFISIEYRSVPEFSYTASLQDIATAIVWVYNNITHYSGDKEKVFLMGHGYGAHLAAMILVQDKYLKQAGGTLAMLRGVVTVEGVGFDIPYVIDDLPNKVRDGFASAFGNSVRDWKNASPVTHVQPEVKLPPMFFVYSDSDTPFAKDARRLSAKLSEGNTPTKVKDYSQRNSAAFNRDIGKNGNKVGDDIVRFFYECYTSL